MTNDSYNSISSMGDHSADKSAVLKKANELLTMGEIEFAWKQVAEFCLNNSRDPEMLAMLRELERVRMRKEPSGTKISFIQIVLNGMPFMEYVLKSIYRYAHEIIIVEGAVENCMFAANPDGSSKDGTVEFVRSFPDPDNKIRFIQGKWPEKLEMTNEAIRHVTGDYVWIIDSDEIYRDEDIEKIIEILKEDPSITQIGMIPYNFWKGFDYYVESDRFTEHGLQFQGPMKFLKGARFINHRPVQLKYPGYLLTADYLNRIDGTETKAAGIRFCHYSYILESQVYQKIELYHRYGWGKSWHIDLEKWYNECFLKWTPENRKQIEAEYPVWTGDTNSHTVPFTGEHPKVIQDFIAKFRAGEYKPVITQNQCEDNNSKLSDNTATVNTSHQILDQVRNFSEATSMEKLRQGNVVVQIDSAEFTLKKLGTDSGGWVVPVNIISEDAICYCVGAGRDISFDVSLVTEYGCDVHIFDPAPTAQARVSTLKDATYKGMKIGIADSETEFYEVNADHLDKIKFLPYGILSRSETRTFYRTSHNEHISYSIFDTNNTKDRFDAECFNLTDVTERLGHRKIDLLKLNVKGA
ncbi:MAG: glycosyltransferase family 2 protein, partial [Sedimentisphaerales bacterium]|nr:glycosyltransferase family 2 protein [Sedimentisphaerales bacterium]